MTQSSLFELNAVEAVATHRGFRRAAIELGVSPSALSHAISTLEGRLGVRLFNRTTRSVSLSQGGARFLARVSPALREISSAIEAVNEYRDTPAGLLRLNATQKAADTLIPLIIEFLARYPDMQVDLVTEGRLIDIVAEGFDVGIRIEEMVPQDMIAVACGPDIRFLIVGAPGYFAQHGEPRAPADLLRHNCIRRRLASGSIYRWELEKRGEQAVIDVRGSLTLDNDALMVKAALAGTGLAFMNEDWVEAHLAAGHLKAVMQDWTPPFAGLRLYYPGHRHVPAGLRAFIDLVRESTAKLRIKARGRAVVVAGT